MLVLRFIENEHQSVTQLSGDFVTLKVIFEILFEFMLSIHMKIFQRRRKIRPIGTKSTLHYI